MKASLYERLESTVSDLAFIIEYALCFSFVQNGKNPQWLEIRMFFLLSLMTMGIILRWSHVVTGADVKIDNVYLKNHCDDVNGTVYVKASAHGEPLTIIITEEIQIYEPNVNF